MQVLQKVVFPELASDGDVIHPDSRARCVNREAVDFVSHEPATRDATFRRVDYFGMSNGALLE
jgi:hypothetical protein